MVQVIDSLVCAMRVMFTEVPENARLTIDPLPLAVPAHSPRLPELSQWSNKFLEGFVPFRWSYGFPIQPPRR